MIYDGMRVLGFLAILLLARTAVAGDSLIDGVPLPDDVAVASQPDTPPAARPWLGSWIGSWDGVLKHILVVESLAADGQGRVVYAIGDYAPLGIKRSWHRLEATFSDRTLTLATARLSIVYQMTDQGTLKATYATGNVVSRATMFRADLASLRKPDTIVAWTGGTSELVQTDLVENGRPIRLEVVTFKPSGDGPFPLAVINHGSTGRGTDPDLFRKTWADPDLAELLTDRGWMVAFPQRRGRGRSDGLYDEGFAADRTRGYTCEPDRSLAGADRASIDIAAAVTAIRRRPDVAQSRILIAGQSRGGVLAVAYAGEHADQVLGVINFVGGWMGTGCPTAELINKTLFERGARFGHPTLWLYGHHDSFYPIEHSRGNFEAFRTAGGQGTFLEFDVPGGNGHGLISAEDLWRGPVTAYLDAIKTADGGPAH